jgi:hypothetical protein
LADAVKSFSKEYSSIMSNPMMDEVAA